MNFFADTNIPIGYTVIHDKWHPQSKRFINNNENPIFWSNLVKKEYNDRLDNIWDLIDKYLNSIITILKINDKDFDNYSSFERFILKRTRYCELDDFKKKKILDEFWQINNFTFVISKNLYSSFIKFAHDFQRKYSKNDLKLNEIMILHDCGLDNYLKYYNYASKLFNEGIHNPDCKIIVDAHDCGLTHKDLIFISNDIKMIEAISKIDTSCLEIIEFKVCNSLTT